MPGTYVEPLREEDTSLIFKPNPFHRIHTPLFNSNFTPRFLYRLVAPQTAGTTTSSTATSPAAASGTSPARDIFSLSAPKAANALLNHLLWQRGHEDGCNLMSWTSSLLFALQYALYRHHSDGDDLHNIYLVVLDTREFPTGTFIQDMEIMRAFAGADGRLRKFVEFREGEYYFGEYLTQGRLDIRGRCVCASVARMIELGLFELQPGFVDERCWRFWPKRVLEFRRGFVSGGKCVVTTEGAVEIAVDIARRCFGGRWTVPCALMLLALQPRRSDDAVILRGFKESFSAAEIRSLALHSIKIDSRRLPEVEQFRALVELVNEGYALSEYRHLVGWVRGLRV